MAMGFPRESTSKQCYQYFMYMLYSAMECQPSFTSIPSYHVDFSPNVTELLYILIKESNALITKKYPYSIETTYAS